MPLVALTAFACLDWLPSQNGSQQRRVVVRGGSGGTGSIIIQCQSQNFPALIPFIGITAFSQFQPPTNNNTVAKVVYDCHVTAICSGKNSEYVQNLGSDEVIDYTSQDVVNSLLEEKASSPPYDLIVDCVGGTDLFNAYVELLNPKGAYVTIVGDKTGVKTLGGPPTYFTSPSQIARFIRGYIWGPRYACM